MKSRALWRVSLDTTVQAEEAVAALLESHFNQTPSTYTDVETGRIIVTVFVSQQPYRSQLNAVIEAGLERLRGYGLDPGSGRISIGRVRKKDWAESWKRHFKPFTIGSKLLVKPSWNARRPVRGQKMIVIDPGLSFGTGQHPTTRFCLEQLVSARDWRRRQAFLDVGTGSGILGIAAAKIGYRPVKAFDFDPAAVRVAKQNAKKNRVRVTITRADITRRNSGSAKYDVICANLTADLLESGAGQLKKVLKPRGLLVLAGILHTQVKSVLETFSRLGLPLVAQQADGEWESLLLRSSDV